MGLPVCGRLVAAGWEVAAADARPEREAAVRAAGARWASGVSALVDEVDVVLTVLPGAAELGAVMAQAMGRLRPGMAWIDMTSGDPRPARALVRDALARGADVLDAALGGGVPAAESGTLQL